MRPLRLVCGLGVWLLTTLGVGALLFLHSHTSVLVAGHDAVVTPTWGSYAVLETGPYLPDVRMKVDGPIGVRVLLGKTTAATTAQIVSRYAAIGAHPGAEVRVVSHAVADAALDAAVKAAVIGLVPIAVWLMMGAARRRELGARIRPHFLPLVLVAGLVTIALVQPWRSDPPRVRPSTWMTLPQAVPEVPLPVDLAGIEIQGGAITSQTRRLVQSAISTYDQSKTFYAQVRDSVIDVKDKLHEPASGDVVGLLVSDRHDNIGMDQVAQALGDAGGASVVIDAGDDTSTGKSWEAFSLDSLADAFSSYDDRVAIAGNHDHGSFVSNHLKGKGWTHLTPKPTDVQGVSMLGLDDPRSSGLGNWRDEKGLSFAQITFRLSDQICALDAAGKRVSTVVVHDANMAMPALERGCTDLVLGGHLHVQVGPQAITGPAAQVGHRYTNGTTGGAAYAFALGSKLRREAEVTLVTWHDKRPVGIQPVRIATTGTIVVEPYVVLNNTP